MQTKVEASQRILEVVFDWTEEFKANMNSERAVEMIKTAAEEEGFEYVEMEQSNPWGEDFGYITINVNGAMFGVGAGIDSPSLHHPDYDFPDELLETGKRMFLNLINQVLQGD